MIATSRKVVIVALLGFLTSMPFVVAQEHSDSRQRAQNLLEQGKFRKASLHFRGALTKNPNDNAAEVGLANAYFAMQKLDKAEYHAEQVLKRQQNNEHALVILGRIDIQQGQFADAHENLKHAVSINPDNPSAQLSLGNVLNQLGETEAADEAFAAYRLLTTTK